MTTSSMPRCRGRRSTGVLLIVATLVFLPVSARGQTSGGNDLFVLTAAGGKLKPGPGGSGTFQLALRRPERNVTVFSDRPERRADEQALADFVQGWDALGFGEVPPNAALVLSRAPENQDVMVLELSQPRLASRGRTLIFVAKPLSGSPTGALREFGTGRTRSSRDGSGG